MKENTTTKILRRQQELLTRHERLKGMYKRNQVFSVPLIGNRKLVFKVPPDLLPDTFFKIDDQLKLTPQLDADKDHGIIAALAAIILLQHFPGLIKRIFKRPLTYLLKRNVDPNKSLALVDLLYMRLINEYVH